MGTNIDKNTKRTNTPLSPLNIVVAVILIAGVLFYIKPTSVAPINKPEALFSLGGKEYTADDLPFKYSQPLFQLEQESQRRKMQIISAAAIQAYVEQQVADTGENREVIVEQLFQPQPPTTAQIENFYQHNQTRIQVPFEQAKERITALLIVQDQQRKQKQLLDKLSALKELKINQSSLVPPIAELDTKDSPSKGAENTIITLVEFSDYQCQHCRSTYLELDKLLQPYMDRIRYVYINAPINNTKISRRIAEGAACASQQDKFWQYHDLAFKHQGPLTESSPQKLATALKLDLDEFQQCSSSKATADKILSSEQQAINAGVTTAPSFFINGRKLLLKDLKTDLITQLEASLIDTEKQGNL